MDSNPERWARIQRVFHEVADLAAGDRTLALHGACNGDEDLRASVRFREDEMTQRRGSRCLGPWAGGPPAVLVPGP